MRKYLKANLESIGNLDMGEYNMAMQTNGTRLRHYRRSSHLEYIFP
jgi:hypothetical protein